MIKLYRRSFIGMLVLAVFGMTLAPLLLQARPPKSEDELIASLSSPKDKVVANAIQDLEKNYPNSPKSIPEIKKLLTDPRPLVKRKAAWALGAVNADVSKADLKNIATLLSGDRDDKEYGLKALRGLKAQSTIPQIIPLLKDPNKNVMRDAIRTLAVLGDKSLIPDIKPFLTYPDLAVQKDAADAIAILKEK
jgi:HEAT repeat protein